MYDELILRLRDAAKMSEALAVLLPHSEGNARQNCTTKPPVSLRSCKSVFRLCRMGI